MIAHFMGKYMNIKQLTNIFYKKAQEEVPFWYEMPNYKQKVREIIDAAFASLLESMPVSGSLEYDVMQQGKDVTVKVTALPVELSLEDLSQSAQQGLDSIFPRVFRVVVTQ